MCLSRMPYWKIDDAQKTPYDCGQDSTPNKCETSLTSSKLAVWSNSSGTAVQIEPIQSTESEPWSKKVHLPLHWPEATPMITLSDQLRETNQCTKGTLQYLMEKPKNYGKEFKWKLRPGAQHFWKDTVLFSDENTDKTKPITPKSKIKIKSRYELMMQRIK